MKRLSTRSIRFIEMFLKMKDMHSIQLPKHDVKILYDYYRIHMNDYFILEDEITRLNNIIDELQKELNEYKEHEEFEYLIQDEERFNN